MTTSEMYHSLKAEIGDLKQQIRIGLDEVGGIELAMQVTGLTRQAVYEKTSAGDIPHYKKGKRLYFKRSELMEWLTSHPIRSREQIEQVAANL